MPEPVSHFGVLRTFARVAGARPWHYVVPLLLAVAAASLEGLSMGLLVPLARGLAKDDFSFVWRYPVIHAWHERFPHALGSSPNRSAFLLIVVILFSTSMAALVLSYVGSRVSAWRDGRFAARVKTYALTRCLSFGKQYFDRHSQANVGDVIAYSEIVLKLLSTLERAVDSSFRLVAQTIVMIAISWRLTLFMAVALPLLRLVDRRIVGRSHAAAEEATKAELLFSRRVHNALSCVPLIKAYAIEQPTVRTYEELTERLRILALARDRARMIATPLQQGVGLVALLGVVCLAVLMTSSDHTTDLSMICAFLLVAKRSVPLLGFPTDLRLGISHLRPYLDRLTALFDDREKFFVTSGSREFHGVQREIELRNLWFAYDDATPALRGISARIPAGQTTALVGETGCGKTTVASIVARMYECPPGSVLIDGVDIREFSRESIARRLAFVGQDAWLFNDSLRANLTIGLQRPVSDAVLGAALERVRLGGLLARLPEGLDAEVGDRGVRLSGGEKQRLCIARALLRDADLIILDEATASLDSETEQDVLAVINRATAGRTVISIAHRLSTIREADQILVLSAGQVIQAGSWWQLVAEHGPFSRMWEMQTQTAHAETHALADGGA